MENKICFWDRVLGNSFRLLFYFRDFNEERLQNLLLFSFAFRKLFIDDIRSEEMGLAQVLCYM